MITDKILCGHCTETGKKFCIELKQVQSDYYAVNFVDLSEEAYKKLTSEITVKQVTSASSILPCRYCSSRKVSGCSCNRKHNTCKANGPYDFQCMYCDKMVIDRPKSADMKIYVTSARYDNIGEILSSMKVKFSPYTGKLDCDLLFINCGTSDVINPTELAAFVQNGGCVYASDFAADHIAAAFPGYIQYEKKGSVCKIPAYVEDPELEQISGKKIDISFDLPAWAVLKSVKGKVLLKDAANPIMTSFKYGEGTVFYTSFHNHSQASEKEKLLLQLLLLKQMGSSTNQSIEQIGDLLGINISSMRSRFRV